jgi:hypothetical protein
MTKLQDRSWSSRRSVQVEIRLTPGRNNRSDGSHGSHPSWWLHKNPFGGSNIPREAKSLYRSKLTISTATAAIATVRLNVNFNARVPIGDPTGSGSGSAIQAVVILVGTGVARLRG